MDTTRKTTARRRLAAIAAAAAAAAASAGALAQAAAPRQGADDLERGRYLVKIAGCNDCHTAGYGEAGGRIDEGSWLMGSPLGWRGPWGTTYATNLRLYFAGLSEEQWLARARALQTRPPMPWFNVQAMAEPDLRAIYRFVRALGPAGQPAPAGLPPGAPAPAPVAQFP
jgi:mono/diheme cytochrome c family protein